MAHREFIIGAQKMKHEGGIWCCIINNNLALIAKTQLQDYCFDEHLVALLVLLDGSNQNFITNL